jgi:hypothetical protein
MDILEDNPDFHLFPVGSPLKQSIQHLGISWARLTYPGCRMWHRGSLGE